MIILMFIISSWAIVITNKEDNYNVPTIIQNDNSEIASASVNDNADKKELEDDFQVYELMYPPEENGYPEDYLRITKEVQKRNLESGWGNAGPAWYDTPVIENGKFKYLPSTTRAPAPSKDKLLVIFINFTDSPSDSNHDPDTRDTKYFNETVLFNQSAGANTMYNYYREVSYYQYNLTGKCAKNSSSGNGWYTASQNESYYGKYELSTSPPMGYGNAIDLVMEAVNLADPDVNFSEYDSDGNTIVDHIMIVHAGLDDASDGDKTGPTGDPQIWSHRGGAGGVATDEGIFVMGYTMLAEKSAMGVYAHEYGHDLGLWDLYNTSGGYDLIKYWDIMAGGAYNQYGGKNRPAHFSSWNKEFLGWHSPITVNETNNNQGIKTVRATSEPTNENTSFKVNLPNSQEWFYVENRYKNLSSYDAGLPESGIIIWHIDESIGTSIGNSVTPGYWNIENAYPEDGNLSDPVMDDAAWAVEDNQHAFNSTTYPRTSYNNGTLTTIIMDKINNSGNKQRIRILLTPDPFPPAAPVITSVLDVPNDNGHAVNVTFNRSGDDGIGDDDVETYTIFMNDTGEPISGNKHAIKVITADDSSNYSYIVYGLNDTTDYHFSVKADDGPNESPWSNNMTGVAYDNIANPPTSLVVTDTLNDDGGNITLTWTLSIDDSLDIVGYNISMNDTGQGAGGTKHWIATVSPGTTTFKVGNLTNGITYYFNISAFDEVYNKGYSNEGSASPADDWVGFPTGLSANPPSWTQTNSFTISWTNPVDNAGIVGAYYKLDSMPQSDSDGKYIAGAGITQISGVIVDSNGTHAVYVWLVDGEGNIEFMNWDRTYLYYDGAAPDQPINLTATPSGWTKINSFDLNWTNPTDLTNIVGAYYKMDTPPTANDDGVYTASAGISSLASIAVPDDTKEYSIWVWLRDGVDNVNYENRSRVTLYYDATAPSAPTNLMVTPSTWTSVNSFNITWTNPTDLSGIVGAYYTIDDAPITPTDGVYVPGVDRINISDIQVGSEGMHTIYIWLVDNATNVDHLNRASISVFYDNSPPAPPENVKITPSSWNSTSQFAINWSNPSELSGVAGAYYKIGSKPKNDYDGVYTVGNDIDNITQVPVLNDGEITVYVWLNDSAGNVDYNNYNKSTVFRDTAAPGLPWNFIVTPSTWTNKNYFSIKWNNPSELSGIAGAYYKFDSSPTFDTDGTYVAGNDIRQLDEIQVLGSGEHTIYIWLVDLAGNVDFNNHNSTTLKFDDQAPGVPISLSVAQECWASENGFDISWVNPADLSGIAGAYYKWGSPPEYAEDGHYKDKDDIIQLDKLTTLEQGMQELYVWLRDKAGNFDHARNSSVTILYDHEPPDIKHSKVEKATKFVAINLYALIEDNLANIRAAYVFYKTDLNSSYFALPMTHKGNSYEVQIPAHKVSENSISYFLMALDNAEPANRIYFGRFGETFSNITAATDIDIGITEDDLAAPTISHVPVTTGTVNKPITLTALVHDDASGVAEVLLYYKLMNEDDYKTKTMIKSYTYYIVTIDAEDVTIYGLEYYIGAMDSAPSQNRAYFGLYGHSTVQPDARTDIDITITETDTTPPIITYGPIVRDLKENSANIFWLTDEPADSRLEWGVTSVYLDMQYDSEYTNEHSMNLSGLSAGTLYHFQVHSTDEAGNGPTSSKDATFTTPEVGVEDTDGDGILDESDMDDDNDGMKDEWEEKYNFDPKDFTDADNDVDYDGFSNRAEYFAGSDPWDPRSTPVGQSDRTPPTIVHTPIRKGKKGDPVTIKAEVTDNLAGVKEVLLYYRIQGEGSNYTVLSMGNKTPFTAIIPGTVTESASVVEYYILARDFGFNTAFYGSVGFTEDQPDKNSDIDIIIKESIADEDDDIFEMIGGPLGVTDAGMCIVILIVVIITLIGIGYVVSRASKRQEEREREKEAEERYARRQREIHGAAYRTGGYPRGAPHPDDRQRGRDDRRAHPRDMRAIYQQDYQTPPPTPAAAPTPAVSGPDESDAETIDFRAPASYNGLAEQEMEYEEGEEPEPEPEPEPGPEQLEEEAEDGTEDEDEEVRWGDEESESDSEDEVYVLDEDIEEDLDEDEDSYDADDDENDDDDFDFDDDDDEEDESTDFVDDIEKL